MYASEKISSIQDVIKNRTLYMLSKVVSSFILQNNIFEIIYWKNVIHCAHNINSTYDSLA